MIYKKGVPYLKKNFISWNKDSIFDYMWVNKFVNQCIWEGKKYKIELLLYDTLKELKKTTGFFILYLFEILFLLKPFIILRWIRRGKKWHQIARPIHEETQFRVAFLFLAKSFRLKPLHSRKKPSERLEQEILNIVIDRRSKLLDFKSDIYKIAIYNRSLFRFKW